MSGFAYIKGYAGGKYHFETGVMIRCLYEDPKERETWEKGFNDAITRGEMEKFWGGNGEVKYGPGILQQMKDSTYIGLADPEFNKWVDDIIDNLN